MKTIKEMKRDYMYLQNLIASERELNNENLDSSNINDSLIIINSKIEEKLKEYFTLIENDEGICKFSYNDDSSNIVISIDTYTNSVRYKTSSYMINNLLLKALFNSDYYNEISSKDIKDEVIDEIHNGKKHLDQINEEIRKHVSLIKKTNSMIQTLDKFEDSNITDIRSNLIDLVGLTKERLHDLINKEFLITIKDDFIIDIDLVGYEFKAEIYLAKNYNEKFNKNIIISNQNFRESDLNTLYNSGILFECRK